MTYFVTNRCNYTCKHCFLLDKLNIKCEELSLDEVKRIGIHIKTMQRVHIGGGEPLLRKDIAELVTTISNEWDAEVMCLPTNGSSKKQALAVAQKFNETSDNTLRFHFSLNVLNKEMDTFTNHKGSWDKWIDTIFAVKEISRNNPNLMLLVLTTFNDFNQNKFQELMDFVMSEVQPDDFSFSLVRKHKQYNPELEFEKFNNYLHKYYKEESCQSPFLRAYREKIREVISDYYQNPRFITPCYSGKTRVVMSPEGNVYPCENIGYPEGANQEEWFMGNIRDYDYNIHKLLKGEKARLVQKKIRDTKCHCHHGVDLSLNLLCSMRFKIAVFFRGLKYFFKRN